MSLNTGANVNVELMLDANRERENLLQVHLDYTALLGGTG